MARNSARRKYRTSERKCNWFLAATSRTAALCSRVVVLLVGAVRFDGTPAQQWTDETAALSDLGSQDALLAVATTDRAYAYSFPADARLSDAELAEVAADDIEPALSRGDWAGAVVAGAYVLLVAACFAYFYPLYVAEPLTQAQWYARMWLGGVIVLGGLFLAGQVYEFNHFYHEGLTLQQNLFGATFFVLTGFHGAHVTVGVIWMTTLLVLQFLGRIGPEQSLDVEVAGLYWHFVDVVWIVIFTLVYLIR